MGRANISVQADESLGRAHWTIPVELSVVLEAAKKAAAWHRKRQEAWLAAHKDAEDQLQRQGIQFNKIPVTGGVRIDPKWDPTLVANLTEAWGKAEEHRVAAEEREAWVALIESRHSSLTATSLYLTIDGAKFFRFGMNDEDDALPRGRFLNRSSGHVPHVRAPPPSPRRVHDYPDMRDTIDRNLTLITYGTISVNCVTAIP